MEIKLLDTKSLNKFYEFIKISYGTSSFLLSKSYLDWLFINSPCRIAQDEYDILVAWDNDKIVGMNGHVANTLKYKGNKINMYWMINTMVKPGYRWGLGLVLQKKSIEAYKGLGAISFTETAGKVHDFTGFNTYDYRVMERAWIDLKSITATFSIPAKLRLGQLNIESLKHAEGLWNECEQRYGLATLRHIDFLKWRYLVHPKGDYKIHALFENDHCQALAVSRKDGESVKGQRLIDAFGLENKLQFLLLKLVHIWKADESLSFADFYCTTSPDRTDFENAGFTWLNEEEKSKMPFLLNPLESSRKFNENISLNFSKCNEKETFKWDDIYFVKGDSDRDRPQ